MTDFVVSPDLPALFDGAGVASFVPVSAPTGTACLALMDEADVSLVWQDLLLDGHDHDHGAGSLMMNRGAIGTHLEHDGDFPVLLAETADGIALGFQVNLDPYGSDLDSLRRPAGWVHGMDDEAHEALHAHREDYHHHGDGHWHSHDEHDDHGHEHGDDHEHGDGHGHAPIPDGWSEPVAVTLPSDRAVFGDPAALPEADNTGGMLALRWPAAGGVAHASVYSDRGVRRALAVIWAPQD